MALTNRRTFGKTESERKYATLLQLTDINIFFINFIYLVFDFSLQHLFKLLWITNLEFKMSL